MSNLPAKQEPTPNFVPAPLENGNDWLPTESFEVGKNELNDLDEGEVSTPVIRLENGNDYVSSNLREARDKFYIEEGNIVLGDRFRAWVLWMRKGHIMLPNDKHPGHEGREMCMSFDRKRGTVYGNCEECKLHDWDFAKANDWKNPACDTSLTFGVLVDGVGPAIISFRRLTAKYARQFSRSVGSANYFKYPTVFSVGQETAELNANEKKTFNVAHMSWDTRVKVPQDVQDALREVALYSLEQRGQAWRAILARNNNEPLPF